MSTLTQWWNVTLPPSKPSNAPVQIGVMMVTADGASSNAVLNGVLYGDVWFCSGQVDLASLLLCVVLCRFFNGLIPLLTFSLVILFVVVSPTWRSWWRWRSMGVRRCRTQTTIHSFACSPQLKTQAISPCLSCWALSSLGASYGRLFPFFSSCLCSTPPPHCFLHFSPWPGL